MSLHLPSYIRPLERYQLEILIIKRYFNLSFISNFFFLDRYCKLLCISLMSIFSNSVNRLSPELFFFVK